MLVFLKMKPRNFCTPVFSFAHHHRNIYIMTQDRFIDDKKRFYLTLITHWSSLW